MTPTAWKLGVLGLIWGFGIGALAVNHKRDREEHARDHQLVAQIEAFDALTPVEQRDTIVAREARKYGASVPLMLALARVEDPTGDSTIKSPAGAVGLLQIMPAWQHSFEEDCGCGPLIVRKRNACVGVHIYLQYRDSLPTVEKALRAYVGAREDPRYPMVLARHLRGDHYVSSVLDQLVKETQ